MADDKTTKTPEQPVTDSGPGKETPPAPPKTRRRFTEKAPLIQAIKETPRTRKNIEFIWNGTGSDEQVLSWRYSNFWDRTCFRFGNKK